MIRPSNTHAGLVFGFAAALCISAAASAQQATDMPAGVQPGKGIWAFRDLTRYTRYDDGNTGLNRGDIDQVVHENVFAYGVARELVAMVHVPVVYRDFSDIDGGDAEGLGLADLPVMLQWRFWRHDAGTIDTSRAVLFGGLEVPSGDEGFSSESLDPFLGIALTHIHGRHGLNGALKYQVNTGGIDDPIMFNHGSADALTADASYLYRLTPNEYAADTRASTYLQLQLLGRYETNGDHELMLAPGYLYEAQTWAAEITVRVPLIEELDERPETTWGLTAGVRFLF